MKTRSDYEAAIRVVGEFVRAWNPYALIDDDTPEDEFDAEIARLVTHLPRITDGTSASHAISAVFSESFEPTEFTPEQCLPQGHDLYSRLVSAGLVSRA